MPKEVEIDNVGSSFFSSKPQAAATGQRELGKEVIIEAQRLGVETVAVDRYSDAPAMGVAHRSHVIDMLDAEALKTLIRSENRMLLFRRLKQSLLMLFKSLKRKVSSLFRPHERLV